jgi:molybdenum cofactor biosynthesis protein B
MTTTPHPDLNFLKINCAVITISDTRTEETDHSGQIIRELLENAGHQIMVSQIIKDDPKQIEAKVQELVTNSQLDTLILNGGTGIANRDRTYDAIEGLLEKILPGFGELFRFLSYQEIGSRAIASRAIAGVYQQKLIFSLPGASNAVKLGLEKLILPELNHLIKQLRK